MSIVPEMNQAGQGSQNVEIKQTKRDDHGIQLRRQAAATALQQYSVLALHSVRDVEVRYYLFSFFFSSAFFLSHYRKEFIINVILVIYQTPARTRLKMMW